MFIAVLAMFHFRVARFFTAERLVGCRLAYEVQGVSFFEEHYNFLLIFLLGSVIPLSITAFNYWKVVQKIRNRQAVGGRSVAAAPSTASPEGGRNASGAAATTSQRRAKKSKRKTVEMLIVIVLVYVVLCGPLYAVYLISYFVTPILPDRCDASTEEPAFYLAAYFMAVFSICINPVIYCYYKKEFRTELKAGISVLSCRKVFQAAGDDSAAVEDTTLHSGANGNDNGGNWKST